MPRTARNIAFNKQHLVSKAKKTLPYLSAIGIIFLSIANIVVPQKAPQEQEVLAAVDPWENEVEFWKEIVRLHPTYRDGYIQLAELYQEKGLQEAAKQAI